MRKKLILLFSTFLILLFITMFLPLMAAAADMEGILLDPLYIVSSIATIMFGLMCFSLGRNLHHIDEKLTNLAKTDTCTKSLITKLSDKMQEMDILLHELKSEHEIICGKERTHK